MSRILGFWWVGVSWFEVVSWSMVMDLNLDLEEHGGMVGKSPLYLRLAYIWLP